MSSRVLNVVLLLVCVALLALSPLYRSKTEAAPEVSKKPRWEYRMMSLEDVAKLSKSDATRLGVGPEEIEKGLTVLGEDGWELIMQYRGNNDVPYCFLKRQR